MQRAAPPAGLLLAGACCLQGVMLAWKRLGNASGAQLCLCAMVAGGRGRCPKASGGCSALESV
jgi:hypothetical protein